MKNLLVFFCIVITSCTSMLEKYNVIVELNGKKIETDSSYIGAYPQLLCDNLLFSKYRKNHYAACTNMLSENKILESKPILNIGNGPFEFHEISLTKKGNSIFVLDGEITGNKLNSLTEIPLSNNKDSITSPSSWKIFTLKDISSLRYASNSYVVLSDSTLLLPGAPFTEIGHLFSIIDYKKQKIKTLDFWPSDDVDCDSLVKHSVYTDNCKIFSNEKGHYLYVCGEERFAFIFTIDNRKINILKELYNVYPNYKDVGNGNYNLEKRSPKRLKADVNNEHIFTFLIEQDIEGNSVDDSRLARFGNTIEVYNWEGEHIKTIKLDHFGKNIKIFNDNKCLLLFSENPNTGDPEIWKYDI